MNTTEATRKATVSYPSDTELLITREFDAPRSLVLAAITQPDHVRQWYGMSEDGMKVCEIDFRVGGKWHYVLAGPPGEDDISFSGEYLEIDAPDRFVSTESFDNMPGASYVATVTLSEADGKTTLRTHLLYPSQEWRDGHVDSGMEYGMNISYNRLEALLARLS
ncbi:MAG TPA: SRPBCC family protein [Propionibacteriaceae bacterium]|nr:SRPBCC family protein [Propionibacteriaceae bacterium]